MRVDIAWKGDVIFILFNDETAAAWGRSVRWLGGKKVTGHIYLSSTHLLGKESSIQYLFGRVEGAKRGILLQSLKRLSSCLFVLIVNFSLPFSSFHKIDFDR